MRVRFEDWREQGGFTAIPNVVLRETSITPAARTVYAILRMLAWRTDEDDVPTLDAWAEIIGVSVRALTGYLKELVDAELVTRERPGQGKPNRYVLRPLVESSLAEYAKQERQNPPISPPSQHLSSKGSEAIASSSPPSGEIATNGARLGPIGERLLNMIQEQTANGRRSWDVTFEAQKMWDTLLVERPPGFSPAHVLGELIRVIYQEDLTSDDWKRASRLCRLYGKSALRGVTEAIKASIPLEDGALWAYATKVATNRQAEMRE